MFCKTEQYTENGYRLLQAYCDNCLKYYTTRPERLLAMKRLFWIITLALFTPRPARLPKVLSEGANKRGNSLRHSVIKFVPSNKLTFCCSGRSKSRWLKSYTMWTNDHPGQGTVLVVMVLWCLFRVISIPLRSFCFNKCFCAYIFLPRCSYPLFSRFVLLLCFDVM